MPGAVRHNQNYPGLRARAGEGPETAPAHGKGGAPLRGRAPPVCLRPVLERGPAPSGDQLHVIVTALDRLKFVPQGLIDGSRYQYW
jgi:hypothetical protein